MLGDVGYRCAVFFNLWLVVIFQCELVVVQLSVFVDEIAKLDLLIRGLCDDDIRYDTLRLLISCEVDLAHLDLVFLEYPEVVVLHNFYLVGLWHLRQRKSLGTVVWHVEQLRFELNLVVSSLRGSWGDLKAKGYGDEW